MYFTNKLMCAYGEKRKFSFQFHTAQRLNIFFVCQPLHRYPKGLRFLIIGLNMKIHKIMMFCWRLAARPTCLHDFRHRYDWIGQEIKSVFSNVSSSRSETFHNFAKETETETEKIRANSYLSQELQVQSWGLDGNMRSWIRCANFRRWKDSRLLDFKI